ncbi:hypothetical protein TNCV_2270611 [Trichonephila clavipes]|nr:hypothetical protein TNCV_2270611 [Trichonephila clavipes]
MIMAEQHYSCNRNAFQVDGCQTTKCFRDNVDSCVEMVHSSPILMDEVDRGPYDKHTWKKTATAGSDVVQSGRPIFDDFFQHLWPYIGNNTANVVFQMVKRLWLIRIDQ